HSVAKITSEARRGSSTSGCLVPELQQDLAMNKLALASIGTTVIVLAACSDATTGTNASNSNLVPSSMSAAFSTTPAGFEELSTSFNSSDTDGAFLPDFDGRGDRRGRGGPGGGPGDDHGDDRGGPGFGLGLMGGGLGGFLQGDGLVNDHFFRFRT